MKQDVTQSPKTVIVLTVFEDEILRLEPYIEALFVQFSILEGERVEFYLAAGAYEAEYLAAFNLMFQNHPYIKGVLKSWVFVSYPGQDLIGFPRPGVGEDYCHPALLGVVRELKSLGVEYTKLRYGSLGGLQTIKGLRPLREYPSLGAHTPIDRTKNPARVVMYKPFVHHELNWAELETRADVEVITGLDPASVQKIRNADVFIDLSINTHNKFPLTEIAFAANVRTIISSCQYLPIVRYTVGSIESTRNNICQKVDYALAREKYPAYCNQGNAAEWIKNEALQYCHGKGLDFGCSKWPIPGAIGVPNENFRHLLDEGPYDFFFSSHCLEHIPDWAEELKRWAGCLKPGGTFFLYLPHPAMEMWSPGGPWVGAHHVWAPNPMTLVKFLTEEVGITVERYTAHPDASWGFYIRGYKN